MCTSSVVEQLASLSLSTYRGCGPNGRQEYHQLSVGLDGTPSGSVALTMIEAGNKPERSWTLT
jgi:hypothetical protein